MPDMEKTLMTLILEKTKVNESFFVGCYDLETNPSHNIVLERLLIAINLVAQNKIHTLSGSTKINLVESAGGLKVYSDFTAFDTIAILSEVALKTQKREFSWIAVKI